jgi:hypothetical protein
MDQLRKVFFGLEKDTKADDVVWFIHFQLQERRVKTDAFTNLVTLDVRLDEKALHPAAEAAASRGLTAPQAAHAVGPAADDAKGTTIDDPDDPGNPLVDPVDAKTTVKGTLKK